MIAYWLMWVAAGIVLGLIGLWFQHGRGRKKLQKWRGMAFRRSTMVIRETWHHHHYQRTPRARLRAQRRQEPLRWTVGHRRRPDDPTIVRRAAVKAKEAGGRGVERAKLSWMNRTPLSERLDRRNTYRDMGPQMMCGSTRTENGHPCRNPRMIGKDHCQVHPKFSLSFGRRDEEGMTRWERKRLLREQEREQREWAEAEARRRDRQDREQERAELRNQQDRNGSDRNGADRNGSGGGWFWQDRDRETPEDTVGSRNGHGSANGTGDAQPVSSGTDSGGSDGGGQS